MGKKANWHKAKHGLITKAKISFGLQNKKGRAQKRMGENVEKRKTEKKKEKEEKKKRKAKRYGTMTTSMDTCFGLYGATFDIWISCLTFDLSRVLLGFHHNPRFIENRGGKTLNGTR